MLGCLLSNQISLSYLTKRELAFRYFRKLLMIPMAGVNYLYTYTARLKSVPHCDNFLDTTRYMRLSVSPHCDAHKLSFVSL